MATESQSDFVEQARVEFETWVSDRPFFRRRHMSMRRTASGGYSDYRVNDRWNAFYVASMRVREAFFKELDSLPRIEDDFVHSSHIAAMKKKFF